MLVRDSQFRIAVEYSSFRFGLLSETPAPELLGKGKGPEGDSPLPGPVTSGVLALREG